MNSPFLNILNNCPSPYTPVWFMRQAGRALPSYQKLRASYSFSELMTTPELAAKVTLLPVEELGVDAAILFSDILVVPEALGMELHFTDKGPRFSCPLLSTKSPSGTLSPQEEKLFPIYEAIRCIIAQRPVNIPLIGFCGAPFTVFCFMMEGTGRNGSFNETLKFIFSQPDETQRILTKITDLSIHYAEQQVEAGIDAFQLFDTYAGLLPFSIYQHLFVPHMERLSQAVKAKGVPVIWFPRGIGAGLGELPTKNINGIGIDWQTPLALADKLVASHIALQGNLDPRLLCTSPAIISEHIKKMKEECPRSQWIANLGHGVLPETPVKHLQLAVEQFHQ